MILGWVEVRRNKHNVIFVLKGISQLKQPLKSLMTKLGQGNGQALDIQKFIGNDSFTKRVVATMGMCNEYSTKNTQDAIE